jgi:hypothetical protein
MMFSLLTVMRVDHTQSKIIDNHGDQSELDSHIWLFRYHVDRLRAAAKLHGWHAAVDFDTLALLEACDQAITKINGGSASAQSAYRVCKVVPE